jgi:hypothetical protein
LADELGQLDRDYLATRDVEIEIHNLSQLPARIAIDFYIVGRPQWSPMPHKLFSKHSFLVNIAGSDQKRFSLRSDVLQSREIYYATLGENYTSGYEIEGWILFARLPGQPQLFDKVSSSRAMLEHLDWFPEALRKFEEATNTRPKLRIRDPIGASASSRGGANRDGALNTPHSGRADTRDHRDGVAGKHYGGASADSRIAAACYIHYRHQADKDYNWAEGRDNSTRNKSSAGGASRRHSPSAIQGRIDVCKDIVNGFEATPANP